MVGYPPCGRWNVARAGVDALIGGLCPTPADPSLGSRHPSSAATNSPVSSMRKMLSELTMFVWERLLLIIDAKKDKTLATQYRRAVKHRAK